MTYKDLSLSQRALQVDLENYTLQDLINMPSWESTGIESIDLAETFDLPDIIDTSEMVDDKMICLKIKQENRMPDTIHFLQYYPNQKFIKIKSQYEKKPWPIYGYILIPIIPIILSKEKAQFLFLIMLAIIVFISITCLIYFAIRGDAKALERDLIIHINYLRKHGNHKNPKGKL